MRAHDTVETRRDRVAAASVTGMTASGYVPHMYSISIKGVVVRDATSGRS